MRLVKIAEHDGLVWGALLPDDHHTADLDGYAIRAEPAVWAVLEDTYGPMPSDAWRQLAVRNNRARRSYEKLAADCWERLDVTGAVRYRGMAEGLELAAHNHLDVIAEAKKAAAEQKEDPS
jgi:hypothetical protein